MCRLLLADDRGVLGSLTVPQDRLFTLGAVKEIFVLKASLWMSSVSCWVNF